MFLESRTPTRRGSANATSTQFVVVLKLLLFQSTNATSTQFVVPLKLLLRHMLRSVVVIGDSLCRVAPDSGN